jgi:hypothetical protein
MDAFQQNGMLWNRRNEAIKQIVFSIICSIIQIHWRHEFNVFVEKIIYLVNAYGVHIYIYSAVYIKDTIPPKIRLESARNNAAICIIHVFLKMILDEFETIVIVEKIIGIPWVQIKP